MKTLLSLLFAAVLACSPAAFACDSSVPSGVNTTTPTIIVPSCTINYRTVKGNDASCQVLRENLATLLTALDQKGKTYTYVNNNDDANFIIYIDVRETQAPDANQDPRVVMSFETKGLGKTADGHTLFTAVGSEGNAGDAFVSTSTEFVKFVDNGWNCNQ